MTVIYHDEAADVALLNGKTVGVIGYGNLGRPVALNLRDSDVNVMIGTHTADAHNRAQAEGMSALPVAEVVKQAHIIMLMLPDEVMPQVYLHQISPNLRRGHTLIFASGYNVAFGFIEAPPFVDVGMIAPRTIGPAVRERYLSQQGFYSFVGVGQDATGRALRTVLAVAKALGSLRAGAIEITMEQEAELDLFMQQAIIPVFHHLFTTAAELLLKIGYPPEAALLDLYISGEMSDYLQNAMQSGLLHTLRQVSQTGQYGTLSRLDRFNDLKLDRLLEITLDEIRNGRFAQEWAREYADGSPRLRKLLKQQENLDLWEMEQQTIELLQDFEDFYGDEPL